MHACVHGVEILGTVTPIGDIFCLEFGEVLGWLSFM